MPGCQAATMLSWPFSQSIGNSVGLSHGAREERGMVFFQEERGAKEVGDMWKRRTTDQGRAKGQER